MHRTLVAVALVGAFALSGCGYNRTDRAITGAGLGAAGGAAIGAVTGGNPLGGAVIGGLAGGAAGALTSPHDVNLGRPIYR